jgi:hypothetical protein
MAVQRGYSRKIYEHSLGRSVRMAAWRKINEQMRECGLPMNPENLKFVATLKTFAPRFRINRDVLADSIKLAAILGEKPLGVDIKREVYLLRPNLSRDKFYACFRRCGFPFREETEYETKYLAQVFYRLMGNKDARRG